MTRAFIHEFPELENFELLMECNESFLNEYEIKERALMDELDMLVYMGESTDDMIVVMEAEKKGFFETIGEKILQVLKAFKDFCGRMKDKVLGLFSKSKSVNEVQIDAAWKKNPELAKAFMDGLRNGSIKYSDYENIDKMVDDACAIIKQLEADKINSKTAVDKLNDVIEKFNKTLVPSATLLSTLGAAATGIVSIVGFRNRLKKEILDGVKTNKKMDYLRQVAAETTYKERNVTFDGKDKKFKYGDKAPLDADGNLVKKPENDKVAAAWALRISQKAASEYSKPLEIMYGFLAKTTEIMTSGKLFETKRVDAATYANDRYTAHHYTSKTIGYQLDKLNSLDKAPSGSTKK